MKFFIALFAFVLISSSTFASDEKITCNEIVLMNGDVSRTMVLTKISVRPLREGEKAPYKLELFKGKKNILILSEKVIVETEDVQFMFENKAKKISGMIYMDELDQTSLTLKNEDINFDCNE